MIDPKAFEDLAKTVAAMRETMESRYGDRTKESDALFAKVKDMINPPKRKMIWSVDGKSPDQETKAFGMGRFMNAVRKKDDAFLKEMQPINKATLIEGTDSLGGYTVPEEFANQIIKLERESSIIRRLARQVPMGTDTRNVPTQLTNVSATWEGESDQIATTNPTFARTVQVAKKLSALTKFSNEVLADNNVGLDGFIKEIIAEAFALEEDRVGLAGGVDENSDPFDGILYADDVKVLVQAGGSLDYDDVINLPFEVDSPYRVGALYITSSQGLKLIIKLKDAQGRYIWSAPITGAPGMINNYPYEVSDQIPITLGAGASTALMFGNLKKHFWFSDREGMSVLSSEHASDWIGGVLESAFAHDETWFRFRKRMALTVMQPIAFARMIVK